MAFSYAYDWLYDAWNTTERNAIRHSMVELGLKKGLEAHENHAWFLSVKGNWNCKFLCGRFRFSLECAEPTGYWRNSQALQMER